jgi:hypothetical protein
MLLWIFRRRQSVCLILIENQQRGFQQGRCRNHFGCSSGGHCGQVSRSTTNGGEYPSNGRRPSTICRRSRSRSGSAAASCSHVVNASFVLELKMLGALVYKPRRIACVIEAKLRHVETERGAARCRYGSEFTTHCGEACRCLAPISTIHAAPFGTIEGFIDFWRCARTVDTGRLTTCDCSPRRLSVGSSRCRTRARFPIGRSPCRCC